jgi:hypothetical protein
MKTPRGRLTEQNKRVVRAPENRPDLKDDRPKGVLFSTEGSTGWRRRRNLGDYKGNKKEGDFSHLHEKFWGEGDESV